MTCSQAQSMLADTNQKINNVSQITTQCNPISRLQCCKGDSNFPQSVCGPFFGPANQGSCDSIMVSYCQTNPTDKLCACINSSLPVPECNARDCRLTNAMKLSNQISNQCSGVNLTCLQFFNLSPGAKNNVVNGNTIEQNCNLSPNGQVDGTPSSELGIATTVGLVVGVVAIAIILLTIGLVYGLRKKKQQSE